MPLTSAQKQAAMTPCFVTARKLIQNYIDKIGLDTLYSMYTASAPTLTLLVTAFYPDQLYSLRRDLSAAEMTQLSGMRAATLNSLGNVSADWVKSMLRVISNTTPATFVNTVAGALPAGIAGVTANNNGAIDQTSTQAALVNHCITELNPAGAAVRNLIFSNAGNCVAEVNFANHGGTALSGHAHVYPIMCVPLTGHHAMGTPHIERLDYPVVWRQLPVGVNPATALDT